MPQDRPDLKTLGVPALHDIQTEAARKVEAAKRWLIDINDHINERFTQATIDALAALGKEAGTVTQPIGDGFAITGKIERKIEWDSDMLLAAATAMPFDRAKQIFKFAVSVPEKVYDGIKIADPELGATIDTARTIKFSPAKVVLKKDD
jgi:hypothetical protein